MSYRCMNGTHALQQNCIAFDHLVSAEQGHWHVRADRRRGVEIDHELGVVGAFAFAGASSG